MTLNQIQAYDENYSKTDAKVLLLFFIIKTTSITMIYCKDHIYYPCEHIFFERTHTWQWLIPYFSGKCKLQKR